MSNPSNDGLHSIDFVCAEMEGTKKTKNRKIAKPFNS
jgi:hypothetical protein